MHRYSILFGSLALSAALAIAQAPTPSETDFAWEFTSQAAEQGFAADGSSPAVESSGAGEFVFAPGDRGDGLVLNGSADVLTVASTAGELRDRLPREAMSVSAWVAIERPQRWGGILSCVQDNGEYEKGFVLGYNEQHFTFALSTTGADDGDGKLSYLESANTFEAGKWHHVAATFDGQLSRLYVDGELQSESKEQSGELLYDYDAPVVIGAYQDANESYPHDGRLRAVSWSGRALSPQSVRAEFEARQELRSYAAWTDLEFEFLVEPYLTWPTLDGISISFESTFASRAEVAWRADHEEQPKRRSSDDAAKNLHEFRLEGLAADQKYFYQVAISGPEGKRVESEWLSFRTAASPDRAFTFVVIGDTQTNGAVAKRVSDLAWMHRPNLAVHAGDLVDAGTAKRDWTDTFFPSMQPLLGRVPLMPVLGNHEQDAKNYYDYMSLPEPERWYSFEYGNAEFFMIDGNRSLADQSAQLNWLEQALRDSRATWRFAVLHQPPYTSDSNDYGDTQVTTSTRGDLNVRNIVALLERYGIDICFSGHVHDYERTFPIREGKVTPYEEGGVIYVTAAGGGGPLEEFDGTNTWFGHKKARYHHLVYVAIHGQHLEFQAIDEEGRLFDTMVLEKRSAR